MARLLFIALVVLGVYLIVRALRGGDSGAAGEIDTKTLRQCARCGTFLPEEEALREKDRFFCSSSHRDEYRRGESDR